MGGGISVDSEVGLGDADAGVLHHDVDPVAARAGLARDRQGDGPPARELGRVAEQVEHDLAQLGRVGADVRQLRTGLHHQLVLVVVHQRRGGRRDVADEGLQPEGLDRKLHRVGLDALQVEHVGHQRQQVSSGRVDAAEVFEFLFTGAGILAVLQQELAVADHGVQRRAELVAHLGQEDRARQVGPFGHVLGLAQADGGGAVAVGLPLQVRLQGDGAHVVDRHPRHVDRGRDDRDPAHGGQFVERHALVETVVHEVGGVEAEQVHGEDAQHQEGPVAQVEEAQQQGDQQPRQQGRGDPAVVERAEQRGEGQDLDRDQGHQLQVLRELEQERQGPERPDRHDQGPHREARFRIGQIQEQADRLRQQGAGQVGEDEHPDKRQPRPFPAMIVRHEPVNQLE